MADHSRIVNMLMDLQQRIEVIKDELGQIQAQENDSTETLAAYAKVIAPTSSDLEVMGGQETEQFGDCCAVGNDEQFCCSGTLIAPNVVVTADHCQGITRVFFGRDVNEQGEIIRVARQYDHPEVDLRVIVLERDATAAPRRVVQGADIGAPRIATVVGFGTVDQNGTIGYGRKRMAEVPIASLDGSEPGAHKKYGCRPGWEMVAGHRGLAIDTCCGDSGGPLYILTRDGDYVLIGATSRGVQGAAANCGDGGVYVRVDRCLDWIQRVTAAAISGHS